MAESRRARQFHKGEKTMNYPSVFHIISDITKKAGASCVLIGGFAVNYHKVTRQTVDVDFLITEEDFKKISLLLKKTGYKEILRNRLFVRFRSEDPVHIMDIDFIFVDRFTLDNIIKNGEKTAIAKQEFIVPSVKNLIVLKIHALKYDFKDRENKDLPDIINLIRINKLDFRNKEFQEMCLKYGTEEIYNKIKDRI